MLNGIDVHDAQGDVAWHTVAQHNQFAFVRAVYGDRADGRYLDNYEGCKANSLPCGFYHFFRATKDAQKQADVMCATLKQAGLGSGDLSPVLDVEDNPHYDGPWNPANNGKYLDGLRLWLQTVSTAYPQCTPIIYTRASFWKVLGNPAGLNQYPLWIAHYTTNPMPVLPNGWTNYAFWQYAEDGTAAGVKGGCDMNRFFGDMPALQAMLMP